MPGIHEVYLEDITSPNCEDFKAWAEKTAIYRKRPFPFDQKYCVAIRDAKKINIDTTIVYDFNKTTSNYLGYTIYQQEHLLKNDDTEEIYVKYKDYTISNNADLNALTLLFKGTRTCFTNRQKKEMGSITDNIYLGNVK